MYRTVNKGIRQGAPRPKRRVDVRPDRAGIWSDRPWPSKPFRGGLEARNLCYNARE